MVMAASREADRTGHRHAPRRIQNPGTVEAANVIAELFLVGSWSWAWPFTCSGTGPSNTARNLRPTRGYPFCGPAPYKGRKAIDASSWLTHT